jgi:RNA polymerase sigma factor (sigma-70 family)
MQIENYLNMIYSLAWRFHYQSYCDVDDLVSVACIAYYETHEQFNPNKGTKKSTYMHNIFKNAMLAYCKKQAHISGDLEIDVDTSVYEPIHDCCPEHIYSFHETIMALSLDSQSIVMMIFQNPLEFIEQGKPKKSRGHVYRKLRELGWSWGKIWKCFDEIKLAVN